MNGKRYSRRVRDLILLALTLFLASSFLESVAGSVTMSLVMQPYTTVTSPPVSLEEGTAGSSTIYTNNTSAKVSAAAPVPLTYNPNSYNVVTGTYVSGSVPASVETVDTNYFVVGSSGTATSTTAYNPSGYNLNGSTTLVSGATTDLVSNNSAYMTFRSYASASSTSTPITNMNFTSDSSGWTYTEVDPKGYCYNGNWQSSGGNTLGSGGGCHKVYYNDVSSLQPGGSETDIMRITYSFTTPSTSWYSQKASFAWKYSLDSGSYTTQTLTVKATLLNAADVVLETLYSTTTMQTSWQYQTGLAIASALSTSTTYKLQLEFSIVNGGTGNKANIFQVSIYWDDAGIKFTYYSEYTMEVEFTGSSNTYDWTQLVWTVDSAWTTSSVPVTIQVYNYTSGGYPNSGNGYDSYTSNSANTDETRTKTITTNPANFRNGSGSWKIKVKGVQSTTSQFDFNADWVEFKPTYYSGYTVSTEFIFSGMTSNTPTQLNFTVVSEYDTTSVSVTIQVWNYSSSPAAYVTSGEGYLQYTSNGSNETKLLTINTNPQFYTSNGEAKIKITGVKTTTTTYQQKTNQVKLVYSYSSKYDYVLKIIQVSDSWEIRLNAYSDSQKERLKNCTIYFRSASDDTSNQVSIINGAYTKQFGDWYDLPVSAERYIVITLQANNSGTSYVYVYLEIRIPNKTTYAQYVITFEIT
jgi:hypothetical protein